MEHRSQPDRARTEPSHAAYLASLIDAALEAHQAGRLDAAESLYREALVLDPAHTGALHYFGVLQFQRGDHDTAASLMSRALKLDRHDAACWSNRGLVAAALGHLDEAMICYDQALQLQPDFADAHNNFGVALQAQGNLSEAIEQYRLALASNPTLLDARLNLGTVLSKVGRFDEALACYREVLSLDPASAEAHFNVGNAHKARGDHGAAIASFERALSLRADYAEAHINLGSLIGKLGDYAGAEAHYRRAVALKPIPTHLVCLGGSLGAQGRLDEEEGFYRQALALDPHYADAHQNLAWLLLKRGDYRQGWAEFALRWRKSDYDAIAVPGVAEWRGESLEGRRLLLVGEQGFGDHFQFLRFARRARPAAVRNGRPVRARTATAFGRTHRGRASRIQRQTRRRIRFLGTDDERALVYRFGSSRDIPAEVPYLFADKAKIKAWRKRLGATDKSKRKVGLVWAGSPGFGNDRYRSMQLAELDALSDMEDVAWYALQKGPAHAQLAEAPPAFRADDFTAELNSFEDTAALIMNLDLVIAVDTGVAHLAGALGKPVWLMLPANSDWRWLEARSDSPWYPGMRLFRQPMLGDWAPVVENVTGALREGGILTATLR